MASITLWTEIERMAKGARREFKLPLCFIRPVTDQKTNDYGWLEYSDDSTPVLYLRVHRLRQPRVPLARITIVDTLAHELAHLVERSHSAAWRKMYHNIKRYCLAWEG